MSSLNQTASSGNSQDGAANDGNLTFSDLDNHSHTINSTSQLSSAKGNAPYFHNFHPEVAIELNEHAEIE